MKIENKLPRYISFGAIELAPFENEVTKEQGESLLKHKGFNHYVKNGDFVITEEVAIEAPKQDEKEPLSLDVVYSLTAEELAEQYSLKDLKAYAKDSLEITGLSKANVATVTKAMKDYRIDGE